MLIFENVKYFKGIMNEKYKLWVYSRFSKIFESATLLMITT